MNDVLDTTTNPTTTSAADEETRGEEGTHPPNGTPSEATSNQPSSTPNGTSSDSPPPPAATTPSDSPPPAAATSAQPSRGLRLRMKVWTDPATGRRYLASTAILSDPRSGTMTAYAMSDESTKVILLTPAEWNALPFFYFREDGPAPRGPAQPPDVLR